MLYHRVLFTKVSKETLSLIGKGKHVFPTVTPSSTPIDIANATLNDLLFLFVERERKQFTELQESLQKKMVEEGKTLFDSWMLESSDGIQASALALGSRVVLQQSIKALETYRSKYKGQTDETTAKVLDMLFRLYALRRIEIDLPWYLTSRTLSLEQGSAVSEAVRQLCKSVSPYALSLAKGFGIPYHLCVAPIAQDWVEYNAHDNRGEVKGNMSFMRK